MNPVKLRRINVLDHGYVQLVEVWGSEEGIVEAARMSTGKGFRGWGVDEVCARCGGSGTNEPENGPGSLCKQCRGRRRCINKAGDEKLLRFLYENAHATPFEMAGMTIEVQAPIFVFREWHRHRTQSYAERSARYTPLPDVSFLPNATDSVARSEADSKKNKQAGVVDGAEVLTLDAARDLLLEEADLLVMVEDLYQRKLKAGFPKELARTHLTVSRYTVMRASTDLRNWLGFLTLRTAPGAQQEIRMFAGAVASLVEQVFPRTWGLFKEGTER